MRFPKQAAEDSDSGSSYLPYTGAVPMVGGLVSGVVNPPRGTNRIEAGAVQGLMGLGGGLAGALVGGGVGALVGGGAGQAMSGDNTATGNTVKSGLALAALGSLLGASLGTLGGSELGRYAVRRDTLTVGDLKRLQQTGTSA